jgi:hypothetical protein
LDEELLVGRECYHSVFSSKAIELYYPLQMR